MNILGLLYFIFLEFLRIKKKKSRNQDSYLILKLESSYRDLHERLCLKRDYLSALSNL